MSKANGRDHELIDGLSATQMVDAIMPIMEKAFDRRFGEAWNRTQSSGMISLPHARAVIARPIPTAPSDDPTHAAQGATATGFALYRTLADECEIMLIAVLPEARRQGVGKSLLNFVSTHGLPAQGGRIFLEMRRNNPAIKLYTSLGFVKVGERPRYYTGVLGERFDALTLALEKPKQTN